MRQDAVRFEIDFHVSRHVSSVDQSLDGQTVAVGTRERRVISRRRSSGARQKEDGGAQEGARRYYSAAAAGRGGGSYAREKESVVAGER